jgi:hypothetical protein
MSPSILPRPFVLKTLVRDPFRSLSRTSAARMLCPSSEARLHTRLKRLLVAACVVASCLPAAGCVRRRLTVRTFPAGAQAFVDDQEIGMTPCSASFVYYGTRKLTIMKDGYRTETLFQNFNPPWYQIPPLDFVAENVVAREIRDERIVDVQLVPAEIVPQQKLLERAQALRDNARSGIVTPLVNAPHGETMPIHQPTPSVGRPGQGLPDGRPLPYESLPSVVPVR